MAKSLKFHKSLKRNIRFFCENSSVPGLSWLVVKNIFFVERLFWIIFNIIILLLTTSLLHYLGKENLKNPVIVTLESPNLPIQTVKFPGVAVCDINKISKKRATILAETLSKLDKTTDFLTLLEDIKLLGNLYDNNIGDKGRGSYFQDLLDKFINSTGIPYDIKVTMQELTTPCKDMLKDCMWAGQKRTCDSLFKTRLTYDGYCCVFNYVRPFPERYKHFAKESPIVDAESPQGSGVERGLKVTLVNNWDDYFFTTLETKGYMVQIFHPEDYPDKISGSLTDVIVNFGTEVLLSIDMSIVKSTNVLRVLPHDKRECLFGDEQSTVFGQYRHSDCLVECKLKTILTLCDCAPFTLPHLELDQSLAPSICTLIDLPCLNKHRTRLFKYFPSGTTTTVLNTEKYDSMDCPKCYPTCNNVVYMVTPNAAPLLHQGDNYSRLNVFFSDPFGDSLKMDLSQTWFEMISNFGGFLSLFMGISVVSAIELVIFIYRLVRFCVHEINTKYLKYLIIFLFRFMGER